MDMIGPEPHELLFIYITNLQNIDVGHRMVSKSFDFQDFEGEGKEDHSGRVLVHGGPNTGREISITST